ncbi:MAG: (Fe-S)-binding protein [Anaerolineales bacterium]|nr:(Fe-S)-binding protein [Anaerolineales bacterium]
MLTLLEKILFLAAAALTLFLAWKAYQRLRGIFSRGGFFPWPPESKKAVRSFTDAISLAPVFRDRLATSILHALVAWGFLYFLLVNTADVLEGLIPNFHFLGPNLAGDLYRLFADISSAAVLFGMAALLLRRFLLRAGELQIHERIFVTGKARRGIPRDSLFVGLFILFHVGARLVGASTLTALEGADSWQPAATILGSLWGATPAATLEILHHVFWWAAVGSIMAFIPYFPYSKHFHLIMTPLNFLLAPSRRSPGEMFALDMEDETIEQFGAGRIEDLSSSSLMDTFSCIMCNRCQDACPAYQTGKILSPAALEINKRYFLNQEGTAIAQGGQSSQTLLEMAIPEEAVWACTACGACVDICPVGNEPMMDILDIRRGLVLMENSFPAALQTTFRGLERSGNPWNIPPEKRMDWAEGLDIPLAAECEKVDLLWWVGCAPATDARAQKTARAFARLLHAAGVSFAVLGPEEMCTGDAARRSGNEYLFYELAVQNVETLNRVNPGRIVTTCPHCLHTIKNEYPAYGGSYTVLHHTELLDEFVRSGQLNFRSSGHTGSITYHDPCYLGRMNGIYEAPRHLLQKTGGTLHEAARSGAKSFCCGAGGGQMWKEEEHGETRVSAARFEELQHTGAGTVAVSCPFCLTMLEDEVKAQGTELDVRDLAEILLESL